MPRNERKSVFGPLNDKRQTKQINDLYRITRQNSALIAGAGSGDMVLAGVQTVTGAKTFDPNTIIVTSATGVGEIGIAVSVRDENTSAGIKLTNVGTGSTAINVVGAGNGGQGFVYNSTAIGGGTAIEVNSSDKGLVVTTTDADAITGIVGTAGYAGRFTGGDSGGVLITQATDAYAFQITHTGGFTPAMSLTTSNDGATGIAITVSGDAVGMSINHSNTVTGEAGLSITDAAQGASLLINHTHATQGFAINVQAGTINPAPYTVAGLATLGGVLGDVAYVTDATAPTYLGTLTGGGAVKCLVFHNGTAWVSC